jgi:hypothetical protein
LTAAGRGARINEIWVAPMISRHIFDDLVPLVTHCQDSSAGLPAPRSPPTSPDHRPPTTADRARPPTPPTVSRGPTRQETDLHGEVPSRQTQLFATLYQRVSLSPVGHLISLCAEMHETIRYRIET